MSVRNLLIAPRTIWGIVERENYDIVHVTTPVASFITRCALRKLRLRGRPKVIYSVHGFHFHPLGGYANNSMFALLERFAGRYTDYLVVTNEVDEHAALERRIVDVARLRYIRGVGVDTLDSYNPEKVDPAQVDQVRKELGLSDNCVLFVMAAEFNPGKRHRDAINAVARVCKQYDVHLALTSTGPLLNQMKLLARRLGVTDRVHFLGFRDDFAALVRASRAMILPSIREGLPRSVMDALSLAVPVIGCRIRGTAELVEDGCGLLCPPRDVEALAQAIIWMVDHPEEAKEMGRRGRKKMQGQYELRNILRAHEKLYAEALGADDV